jgi:glycosyltransferase involved in cell wall biosynthesis
MKILYILEDGRLGGMAKMILDIAAGVSSNSIAKDDSGAVLKIARSLNLNVSLLDIRFLSKKPSLVFRYFIYFIPDLIKILGEIRRFKPDIVYCNSSQHIKGVLAGRLLRKKLIWHLHDTWQPEPIMKLFRATRAILGVKYFVASSRRTMIYYNLPDQNTFISIPPVNTVDFSPVATQKRMTDKFTVLSVSNINPDKGIDTLIQTAARVNEVRNDVRFKVVGLVPDTQTKFFDELSVLTRQLKVENVEFLGQRFDIRELLSEADIYLCSSNNESGPISVFEAMSMEIPIVSTDVGDLRMIFEMNQSGKVLPVRDFESLANEILLLLNHPTHRRDLGKRGRKTSENYLDISLSVARHINFYKMVVGEKI